MQLTVRDAARLLNVSEKTVYRWIQRGEIPAYRVRDQYRFHRAELLEWASARRIQVSPEILLEPEAGESPLPTLVEALQAGGVVYRLEGADKAAVLRAVVDTLRLPEEVDREFLYSVLLAREKLMSTAVGDGIAIPHLRNPIVLHLPRPTCTLAFLEHGIAYGALDGQPVRILFTLLSPTVKAHLHLLARLGFVLRDPDFQGVLQREASREEIFEALRQAEAALPARPSA